MGWPGQHELEDEEGPQTPTHGRGEASPFDSLQLPIGGKPAATAAQPPLALSEDRVRAQNGRQLG